MFNNFLFAQLRVVIRSHTKSQHPLRAIKKGIQLLTLQTNSEEENVSKELKSETQTKNTIVKELA